MIKLTTLEISQYRDQLSSFEEGMIALEAIEDCEGDLEDAATSLALKIGQQIDRVDWLDGLTKRCRVEICNQDFRKDLQQNKILPLIQYLVGTKLCPSLLVTIVVIYALKQGIDNFCEPLTYKL
jgi:hypothetical protein